MKNFLEKVFQVFDLAVTVDGYLKDVESMFIKVCYWVGEDNSNHERQKIYVEYLNSGKFKFITENGEILDYTIMNSKNKIIDQMDSFIYFLNSRDIDFKVENIPDKVIYKISFEI